MSGHFGRFSDFWRSAVRSRALALSVLAALVVTPGVSFANCVQQMSRIPVAAPAAVKAPVYRANMARAKRVARPAAKPARPRAMKVASAHKPRSIRKVAVHRKIRKKAPSTRRIAAAAPIARAFPAPTPMPVAERALATPLSYALVESTVCETGPGVLDAAAPRLSMARVDEPPAAALTPDNGTGFPVTGGPGFPDTDFPDGGISPGGPGTPTGPGVEPPVVTPPVVTPPITEPPTPEPPVVVPPITEPPVVVPPGVDPPITPPGGEPPVIGPPPGPPPGPPVEPPIVTPPVVTPVPEPGTWALLILGFGLIGARLRATSSARSGCRDRAGRPG